MPFHFANRLQSTDYRKRAVVSSSPRFTSEAGQKAVSKPGFTLIELLVTIAIIGILSTLGTFAYTDSQKKGRDSKRKADIEALRRSLDLMKQDSSGGYGYPACDGASTDSCALTGTNPDMIPASGTPYIKAVPTDPKSGSYTYYPFQSDGTTACHTASSCPKYRLNSCIENTKDPQRDGVGNTLLPDDTCPTGASYSITNN